MAARATANTVPTDRPPDFRILTFSLFLSRFFTAVLSGSAVDATLRR